ncbi:S-adenosyl-L-methionine-dependent methyltransferase [Protomyces lactucae-debilis]|uniref:S-adenosyl-L-methionine-dependent methyltransferase n=1 Tax=Protomyces lactucae-debilis TaxID=2754530 RepID=A0A1Y2FUW0_PROLT|nr:S-adenosyl-L-methionine-dependent methyltransferase [Protomyces lactucae-debilis]ORY87803.1 S-adenosyl-L-methionine-dependent methyltransferase [Protomyces lactucae-debilis]
MSLANAEHFNQKASTYDAGTEQRRFTAELQAHLRSIASWLGLDTSNKTGVKVLDYACGPGAAAFALHDYAGTVLGVDISENMVSVFNERAEKAGLEHMHAIEGNLCVSEDAPISTLDSITSTFQGSVSSNYFCH